MSRWNQALFSPLCKLAHWPADTEYADAQRTYFLDQVIDGLGKSSIDRVLEVGCGNGWVTQRLARQFPSVIGIDINPNRIKKCAGTNTTVMAASVDDLPFENATMDVILSITLLEHLPEPVPTLENLIPLLAPGGRMVHVVPLIGWKMLQWAGFYPNKLRKQFRSISRALAGQKKVHTPKYYEGRETNNPHRVTRRVWHRKLFPRIHGEYENQWQEIQAWRSQSWVNLFQRSGLTVTEQWPLGMGSPYAFGLSKPFRQKFGNHLSCYMAYVVEPTPEVAYQPDQQTLTAPSEVNDPSIAGRRVAA